MSQGIDVPINALVTRLRAKLWTTKTVDFNGRVFRNERIVNDETVIIPETYISSTEYKKDVVFNDRKDAGCFFDVLPERTFENGLYTAKVWICFYVNLVEVYPLDTTERVTEAIHKDVHDQVNGTRFNITGLTTGIEAFSEYDLKQVKIDMHPYYVFRFDTEINFRINEC